MLWLRRNRFVFERVKLRCSSVQSVHVAEDSLGFEDDWTLDVALFSRPVDSSVIVDLIGVAPPPVKADISDVGGAEYNGASTSENV